MNTRKRFASRRFAADEEVSLDELDKQLDDAMAPVDDDEAAAEQISQEADDFLDKLDGKGQPKLPDEEPIVSAEQEVINACNEIEGKIAKAEVEEACQKVESCIKGCEDKERMGRRASRRFAGVEERIGDQAHGGTPSVSGLAKSKVDCATRKEVYGQNTDSKYVASITRKLDRVAAALEARGMKKMAFRIDQLSDRLEASVKH